jgi:hypothetical protein
MWQQQGAATVVAFGVLEMFTTVTFSSLLPSQRTSCSHHSNKLFSNTNTTPVMKPAPTISEMAVESQPCVVEQHTQGSFLLVELN